MTTTPLVSIVIPTYNHADMLRRAVQSVVSQSYTNWNAVVVNNFSTDNTIDIVSEFNDSRISLVNFRNEGVIASSRNKGIELATGEFVAFLDSDDTWSPAKLEACVALLNKGADVVCHAEYWIDENGHSRLVTYGPKNAATRHSLIYHGNRVSTSATMVRTSLLREVGGFDTSPELISTEDYDLWVRLAENNARFEFIDDPLGEYYRHDNNVSANLEKHLRAELAMLDKHFVRDRGLKYIFLKQRRLAIAQYGAGRSFHRTGKHGHALKKFFRSLVMWPLSVRLYAAIALAVVGLISPKNK